jgi:acyl-CoA reductase-like NAD-dependent aldehyde dehydrogenase
MEKTRTYMRNPLNSPTGGQIYLEMNKEEEEKDIEEVKRNYEAAVSEAAKQAEQRINCIRAVAKDERESMEKLIAEAGSSK